MRISFLAPEGWIYVLVALAVSVLLYFVWPWLLLPGLLIVIFFAYFFRNPKREGREEAGLLLSPADGIVMSVTNIAYDSFIGGPAVKVAIFLSVFNVHINRAPLSGRIESVTYRPGKFLPAFKSHASEINERNSIAIAGDGCRVMVHQITGFLARRIVCDVKEGVEVVQRQRIGMIKFGSGTELIFPADFAAVVKAGDQVRGGRTIIAKSSIKGEN